MLFNKLGRVYLKQQHSDRRTDFSGCITAIIKKKQYLILFIPVLIFKQKYQNNSIKILRN